MKLLGLLTIDPILRREFFANPAGVIDRYRTTLSWEEADGLARLAGDPLAPRIQQALDQTNELIDGLLCPRKPCPWPYYFRSQKPPQEEKPAKG
jgi:hypothetical protein